MLCVPVLSLQLSPERGGLIGGDQAAMFLLAVKGCDDVCVDGCAYECQPGGSG